MRVLPTLVALLALACAGCSQDEPPSANAAPPAPSTTSTPSLAPSVGNPAAAPEQVGDAPLDGLTISLQVRAPRPNGVAPSRIRVQNLTGSTVVDPGCRRFANYMAGVADPAAPGSFLRGSTGVVTKCAGPEVLPPGYDEGREGPLFRTRKLPVGIYLAVVDFGDARSGLLIRELAVSDAG